MLSQSTMLHSEEEQLHALISDVQALPVDGEVHHEAFNQIKMLVMSSKRLQVRLHLNVCSQNSDYEKVLENFWRLCFQQINSYQADKQDVVEWIRVLHGKCLQNWLLDLIEQVQTQKSNGIAPTPLLGRIFNLVTCSNKLWRGGKRSRTYYGDAVFETWAYCFQNLDEYDPNICQFITWVNQNLKKTLDKWEYRRKRDLKKRVQGYWGRDGSWIDPTELLTAEDASEYHRVWQELICWVKEDPNHELRDIKFSRNSAITAQAIVLGKLYFGKEVKQITIFLGLPEDDSIRLSKWWYNNRKKIERILNKWGMENAYLKWSNKDERYYLDVEDDN